MPENDYIAVFHAGDNLKGPPAYFAPRDLCREQVEAYQANWCNRGTGIVLRYLAAEMYRPAESLRMSHHTILSNAINPARYRALLAAWKPRRTA